MDTSTDRVGMPQFDEQWEFVHSIFLFVLSTSSPFIVPLIYQRQIVYYSLLPDIVNIKLTLIVSVSVSVCCLDFPFHFTFN